MNLFAEKIADRLRGYCTRTCTQRVYDDYMHVRINTNKN